MEQCPNCNFYKTSYSNDFIDTTIEVTEKELTIIPFFILIFIAYSIAKVWGFFDASWGFGFWLIQGLNLLFFGGLVCFFWTNKVFKTTSSKPNGKNWHCSNCGYGWHEA